MGASATADPAPAGLGERALRGRVAALRDEHARLWAGTPATLPDLGPPVGWLRHLSNERAARRLGVPRSSLYQKIKRYGIGLPR